MQKLYKTIGFFGDSFCASTDNNSWTTILAKKLNCDIKNIGVGGSSIWKAILDFNKCRNSNSIPDINIFCWTNPQRLYHPTKTANLASMLKQKSSLADAVRKYYAYLYFEDKENLNYKFTLEYFENYVLKNIKDKKCYQIFSINPKDCNTDSLEVDLNYNFINDFSLLQFSEYTIKNHLNQQWHHKTLVNHMSIDKNEQLADYFFQRITSRPLDI
jgi:hypothetical protein